MVNRMRNKKSKRKKKDEAGFCDGDEGLYIGFTLILGFFVIMMIFLWIVSFIDWLALHGYYFAENLLNGFFNLISHPSTLYISASRFPLKVPDTFGFRNFSSVQAEYIFYGTPQANGTECISGVAVYKYNQTSHTISSVLLNYSTNPQVVSDMYWNVVSDFTEYPPHYHGPMRPSPIGVFISPDVTLLCPSIINAT